MMEAEPRTGRPAKFELQFLHCPVSRPIAVFVVPKCGTTSTINWIVQMDKKTHRRVLDIMNKVVQKGPEKTVQLASNALVADFPNSSTVDQHVRIANRMFHRYPPGDQVENNQSLRILPPGPYCPMCCARGDGRLKVVIARNPYTRIASYFKMRWIDKHDDSMDPLVKFYNGWKDFRHFVHAVLSHREVNGGFTHNLARFQQAGQGACKPDPNCKLGNGVSYCYSQCQFNHYVVSSTDVYHIRPVYDMFKDERFERFGHDGSKWFDNVFVIHLETLQEDLKTLEKRLCEYYGDCEPLPQFPLVFPGVDETPKGTNVCKFDPKIPEYSQCGTKWADLWNSEVLRNHVLVHYEMDFRLLGYSDDPMNVMPLPRTERNKDSYF